MMPQIAANEIDLMQDDATPRLHITKSLRWILGQHFYTTSSHAAAFYFSAIPNYTPMDSWFWVYFKTKLDLRNLKVLSNIKTVSNVKLQTFPMLCYVWLYFPESPVCIT